MFYGVKTLLLCVRMRRANALVDAPLICPHEKHPPDCADARGCYLYLLPRLLLFSLFALLGGVTGILSQALPGRIPEAVSTASVAVSLASALLFTITLSRSAKRFWR